MSQEAARRYFHAIIILALAVRIGYAFVTPPFQAPDEYSHFSYVKFLHDARRLPIQPDPAVDPTELELHQPPLYYILAASVYPSTNLIEGRPNLPLRFVNILLSMLTVWIAYHFAAKVFPNNQFAVSLICIAVAFTPTYSYTSATMMNGTLATLFTSLGFYLCARAVLDEEEQKAARWSWIGVVAGLGILSKLTAISFSFAAAILLLLTSRDWRTAMHRAMWFSMGIFATAGWWFVRNQWIYGHWLKVVETGYDFKPAPLNWEHATRIGVTLFKTFWAVFGRINEIHFQDIYRFYWWFAGLAVLGLMRCAIQKRKDLPASLAVFLVLAIGVSLACTLYYAYNYNSDQGRYMFPVLIPIATFIAIGLNSIVPSRWHRVALDTVLFAFVGINILVLARLAAFYW